MVHERCCERQPCLFVFKFLLQERSAIMKKVSDFFGCNVFDDRVMKAKLSSKVLRIPEKNH